MVDTDSDKWWLIRIGYKCTDKNILLEPGALISVGRSQQSTILINSSFCSRNHCVFSIKGDILRLRDSNVRKTFNINIRLIFFLNLSVKHYPHSR